MVNDSITSIKSGIYAKGEISFEDIMHSIKRIQSIKKVGSIHSFSGIVRATSKQGKLVRGIKIDAYKELANKSIAKVCEEIKKQFGIIEIILIHFYGEFDISDDLVHVVVASGHREEGFKALQTAVEKYKKEIAVWKREDFEDGTSEWIH